MVKTASTMLSLGTSAPDFCLLDTEKNKVSLSSFKSSNGYLIMFICNHCPFVIHYQSVFTEITRHFIDKGITVLAINSNDTETYPDDNLENMTSVAKKFHYPFPYLLDETQEVAKAYDAVCTHDFFGYNKNLELQYRGRMRELKKLIPVRSGESDLFQAMKQIAETGKGPEEQIPSAGCGIKWKFD